MLLNAEGLPGRRRTDGWLDVVPCRVVEDGAGGVSELDFGPLPLGGGLQPSWFRLANLLPHQLDTLTISDGKNRCYELTSRTDALGRNTSAGDLLLAMARMEGWPGLVANVRGLHCVNAATWVRCRVVQLPLALGPYCRLQMSCF